MAKKQQPEIIPPEAAGSTELALFPKLNLPSVTGITEEMNASFGTMYTRIEAGIAELPTDMTIAKNREKVASYAYSISRTKTGLDAAAKDVAGDAKKIVDAVNDERSQLKTTLDKLRDKARAKLDAWEEAEKAKAERVKQEMNDLRQANNFYADDTAEDVQSLYLSMKAKEYTAEEYGDDVGLVREFRDLQLEGIVRVYQRKVKEEAEAAELEQLRREKAEREAAEAAQRAKEEQERAAAVEAARREEERARIAQEAEEKAKRQAAEAIAKERREFEEQLRALEARAEAEKVERHNAEVQRNRAAEDAKRREIEQEEQRKEAAARAEEQAKQREEKAKADERQRIAEIEAAKLKADQERAADLAHRRKLNAEAVAGIVKACGLSEKDAQAIIIAIYKEQIPHVAIRY